MSFQSRIARRVRVLSDRVSKPILYRRIETGSGPNPARVATDMPVKARISGFSAHQTDGQHVRATDLRVIIPGSLIEQPNLQDKLIIDDKEMIIVSFQPHYIADQVGLWIIQARG